MNVSKAWDKYFTYMISFSPKYKAGGFSETWSLSSRTKSSTLRMEVYTPSVGNKAESPEESVTQDRISGDIRGYLFPFMYFSTVWTLCMRIKVFFL